MLTYIFVLGRQAEISAAELVHQQHFKSETEVEFDWQAGLAYLQSEQALPSSQELLNKLGGSIKLLRVLGPWQDYADLKQQMVAYIKSQKPEHKFNFGLSSYGPKGWSAGFGLELKRSLQADKLKVRLVTNQKEPELSSVQVSKNRLTDPAHGVEFNLISGKGKCLLAITEAVQDFESYSLRDFGKPGRSAKIGMLPPKLAQIMLNLAGVKAGDLVIDPFCGTGTVLMEAMLMGAVSWGADLLPEQVERSSENLRWLNNNFTLKNGLNKAVIQEDAKNIASHQKDFAAWRKGKMVVTEGDLGPLFSRIPDERRAHEIFRELGSLYRAVFRGLSEILAPGERVVLTLPYYRSGANSYFFPEDELERFSHGFGLLKPITGISQASLRYFREDQIVGREVFIWEKLKC